MKRCKITVATGLLTRNSQQLSFDLPLLTGQLWETPYSYHGRLQTLRLTYLLYDVSAAAVELADGSSSSIFTVFLKKNVSCLLSPTQNWAHQVGLKASSQ